ncbi:recombinase family protein [Variovorax sp. IB41]|uniref:recombinase family protein n=1 Tax=Variovorax sp. IB41 TaxID=2779370 RepID=UPI0018E79007|nr:recombinase family protein [Variovorax sp. IB41]MBJ2154604.1 recombinase family protein [Variovorax sp. IB41]
MTPPKKPVTGHRVGYVRVSSADQNDARQLEGLELEKIFTDKASGKDTNRPQFLAMLGHLRDGDHLYVHSMDRLSRSLKDLQHVVESLAAKGVSVTFVKENLTFQKPGAGDKSHEAMYSMLMLQLLGAVGQFERALIKERQREGIAIAKTKGTYKGRKPSLDAGAVATLKELAASGMPKVDIATALGISRASVYQYLKN